MRVLLVGRTGQVGHELERRLPELGEVIATDRASLDVADADALRRAVREARPDAIVNATAYTAVDRAESEPELARRINAVAPGVLAEEAARAGACFVHYSTDYVFDGTKAAAYFEDDPTAPINAYGRTKREGELAVLAANPRAAVLRTSWVYAPRGRNFVRAILERARADGRLRVVADQHGVPTTAAFLARATVALLRQAADGPLPHALYHAVPGGETTWHGFALAIARRRFPGIEVEAIASDAFKQAARRPANSRLSPARARAELGLPATPWEELLDECLAEMAASER